MLGFILFWGVIRVLGFRVWGLGCYLGFGVLGFGFWDAIRVLGFIYGCGFATQRPMAPPHTLQGLWVVAHFVSSVRCDGTR